MNHHIVELDHLMCGVDSPRAAGEAFERMGFTVTPLSLIEAMGLGNRCVLFPSATPGAANYLELMGIVARENVPENMQRTLAGSERVKSMVMATDDCDACYADLKAAGFEPPTPPIHLSREWVFAPDDVVHPSFAVLLPMPAPLGFNVCQHKTLPLYLRAAWTRHPNGALGVTSVIACSSEVARTAAFYERLFGACSVRDAHGLSYVSPARVALRIGDAATIRAAFGGACLPEDIGEGSRFVGIGIRVGSIATLRARLDAGSVPYEVLDATRILVTAAHACGNFIEFSACADSPKVSV